MSQFHDNLSARAKFLALDVQAITDEMNRRGNPVAYSTVAGWLNGHRGERWKVDDLKLLLEVLQTDLAEMAGDAVLVEAPVPALAAREMLRLSPEQQQLVLAMVRSMTQKGK